MKIGPSIPAPTVLHVAGFEGRAELDPESLRATLSEIGVNTAVEWWRDQGVAPQALYNLSKLPTSCELVTAAITALTGLMERRAVWRHRADMYLEQIGGALAAARISTLVVKGSAVGKWYAVPRYYEDVDIIVPSLDEGWAAIAALQRVGFDVVRKVRFGRAWLNTHSEWFMSCVLAHTIEPDAPEIDLHAGAYPIGGNAALSPGMLWSLEEGRAHAPGNQLQLVGAHASMLILVAHVAKNWAISMKDVNDFCVIERQLDDPAELKAIVDGLHLGGIWAALASVAGRVRGFPFIDTLPAGRYSAAARLRFLLAWHRKEVSQLHALAATLRNCWHLRRGGRYYRVVRGRRKVLRFSRNVLLSLRPISSARSMPAQAHSSHLSATTLIYHESTSDEVMWTPIGILTQSAHNGFIPATELDRLSQIAEGFGL